MRLVNCTIIVWNTSSIEDFHPVGEIDGQQTDAEGNVIITQDGFNALIKGKIIEAVEEFYSHGG